ncbi:MAG: FAD-dependent oxidoreductase [Firmicutes bacterium]|nr:FAD-dependent oxidoreductase [Bacillota bacterium]
MESIWTLSSSLPSFPSLEGDRKTDVLIIGGGIAGILCAKALQEAGVNYILLESGRICSGVTKNTTAKITSQHGLVYHKLIKQFGHERAQLYLQANQAALGRYKELCREINCDFEEKDAFVYTMDDVRILEEECLALDTLGFRADFTARLPLPFPVAGAVKFPKQAQFNPVKFLSHIARGLNIYEESRVLELRPGCAVTGRGNVRAEKIIVATHFPFLNKHGSYFIKQYQHRSYVLALENAPALGGMYVDEDEKGLSFRNYQNLLLLGGGSHRTGKKGGAWQELEDFAAGCYPEAVPRYRWATQDCMTLDSVPYIGQYSARTPGLYVATGFNKWGMSSSMLASTLLRDLVLGRRNDYAPVFSPSRSILRPALASNALEALVGLLTPSQKRCPHMGCALKWNSSEHSWDCPCHGSRFSESGALLNNPSTGRLDSKE